jgi:hypothetical protein
MQKKKATKRGSVNGQAKPAVLYDKSNNDAHSRDCSVLLYVTRNEVKRLHTGAAGVIWAGMEFLRKAIIFRFIGI